MLNRSYCGVICGFLIGATLIPIAAHFRDSVMNHMAAGQIPNANGPSAERVTIILGVRTNVSRGMVEIASEDQLNQLKKEWWADVTNRTITLEAMTGRAITAFVSESKGDMGIVGAAARIVITKESSIKIDFDRGGEHGSVLFNALGEIQLVTGSWGEIDSRNWIRFYSNGIPHGPRERLGSPRL